MSRNDDWRLTRRRFLKASVGAGAGIAAISAGMRICLPNAVADPVISRGLLASPGFEGHPVKGVYFFPGEGNDERNWTTHPSDLRDRHWNSDESTRAYVLQSMVDAHVNTIVASYWSNMQWWSPMTLDAKSWPGLVEAAESKPLVILPAIESGFDPKHPELPSWWFQSDFPYANPYGGGGLVDRIGWLLDLFEGRMHLWAQLYDLDGLPRYAVNIIHACSNQLWQVEGSAEKFALGFTRAANEVWGRFGVNIGFTLDTIQGGSYWAIPASAGPYLAETPSVLAIQGFESEVFSGLVWNCPPGQTAYDNNMAPSLLPWWGPNISRMADWKRAAMNDWIATGLPVILDVSNGFDGRKVWRDPGTGFWGDNLDYTDDRWRNWMSQLKNPGIAGICVDCWNGYTEGYAMVPSIEHGTTVQRWLTDLLEPDPREFSHMHYVDGAATHRVYGAICEKWISLGADRGFGVPITPEMPALRGRKQIFFDGSGLKWIYWGPQTGAHEVHGLIALAYQNSGEDGECLGLPVSDENVGAFGLERFNEFEHGRISWWPGQGQASVQCA